MYPWSFADDLFWFYNLNNWWGGAIKVEGVKGVFFFGVLGFLGIFGVFGVFTTFRCATFDDFGTAHISPGRICPASTGPNGVEVIEAFLGGATDSSDESPDKIEAAARFNFLEVVSDVAIDKVDPVIDGAPGRVKFFPRRPLPLPFPAFPRPYPFFNKFSA